jgi:hypothetical protein
VSITPGLLLAGYVLGTAAGCGRYGENTAVATTAASTTVLHPRAQQLVFGLAGQVSSVAVHVPGPVADLVETAATDLQDTSARPDHPTSASAETISGRHVA